MKNFLTIMCIILFALGCQEKSEGTCQLSNIELVSTDHSGCLNTKSATAADVVEKYIVSSAGDNSYEIEHENVFFNCCLPEEIAINVYSEDDTLFFCDSEKVMEICNCICPYNTWAEISGIEKGKHVLCFISGDDYLWSVCLTFKNDMYEEVLVSELTDN